MTIEINHERRASYSPSPLLVLVLVLIKDDLNHQKDAHPKGIRTPGIFSYIRLTS